MTRDKWKDLIEESHFIEKPFLYLYRLYQQYPWWIYGFFFAYCAFVVVDSSQRFQDSGEYVAVFFFVGFGPVFFFFSLKLMLWVMLRIAGFRAEDLRFD